MKTRILILLAAVLALAFLAPAVARAGDQPVPVASPTGFSDGNGSPVAGVANGFSDGNSGAVCLATDGFSDGNGSPVCASTVGFVGGGIVIAPPDPSGMADGNG